MKNYTITVNGTAYAVTVEEGAGAAPARVSAPAAAPAPVAAPAAAPAPASSGAAGSIEVAAQVAGKVWKVVAKVGDKLERGDTVVILEAMKMEIPVVAPEAGTVVSIDKAEGAEVANGDLIATLN